MPIRGRPRNREIIGIDALCQRPRREVLSVWLMLAGAMLLKFVPIIGLRPHGTGGFTIITFIFIYVSARLLRHAVDGGWLPVRRFVLGALGVFALGVVALCIGCWGHLDHYPLSLPSNSRVMFSSVVR